MTEMMKIIAETEGVRTPTRKRTQAEKDAALAEHTAKSAKRKAKSPTAKKAPVLAPTKAQDADAKPKTSSVSAIPMNFVSATGYVREAAFDSKTKMFHIGFAKSTWAMPSSKTEWDAFEKALADPNVEIDGYYRKAFRGRTADMLRVSSEVSK